MYMSKRLISALLCALLVVALSAPALAYVQMGTMLPAQALLRTNAHLREGPSTESASKMILRKGSKVTILGSSQLWLTVQYGNFHGYLYSSLIDTATLVSLAETGPTLAETQVPAVAYSDFTLRYGDRGEAVRNLQGMLWMLGYDEVGATDGAFGRRTLAAVEQFQKDQGLKVDGIVGMKTRAAMEALLR
jgi:murein L,D-transpeptidase YcbB/YkuD